MVAVDVLRGLAALGVVLFHFTRRSFAPDGSMPVAFEQWGWIGEYGVHVFFVLSGCVLPLALDRAGYRVAHFARFLVRRLVRIDLPYIASFALPLLVTRATIGYWAPLFPGRPSAAPPVTLRQLALHLGYANGFVGVASLNPVYWTLAIELQFYVIAGLAFPMLAHARRTVRIGAVTALVLASWLPLPTFVPVPGKTLILLHLPYFALGVLAFHRVTGRMSARGFSAGVALVVACLALQGAFSSALAALLAAGAIATSVIQRPPAALRWLGAVSYSLYLVHLPVGLYVGWTIVGAVPTTGAIVLALVASLAVAQVLHVIVERPALRLAGQIGRSRAADASRPAPALARAA